MTIRPRKTLRRGEPSPAEKQAAREACHERAGGMCEDCGAYTSLAYGNLHHAHGKRRFGWMESENQKHVWLCAGCHHNVHNPKVVPAK